MEAPPPLWFKLLFSILEEGIPDEAQEKSIIQMIGKNLDVGREQAGSIYADAIRVILYPQDLPSGLSATHHHDQGQKQAPRQGTGRRV